jgi:glycogen debranching enzyme
VLGFLPLFESFKHTGKSRTKQNKGTLRISRMRRFPQIDPSIFPDDFECHFLVRGIRARRVRAIRVVFCLCFSIASAYAQRLSIAYESVQIGNHELSRPARPWEFLDAVGKHAGLIGNEAGRFEAWVYPLKIFRDFDVAFVLNNRRIPASSLVRRLLMHPEGPTLTFASDAFNVNETWLVPPEENGAIIRFEINTWEPLQIEASFTRDFQLMWPAGLGGTYMSWHPDSHTYEFGEEGRKFAAVVGSPTAVSADPEFFSNSYATTRSTFNLGVVPKGRTVQYVFIAGTTKGIDDALGTYQRLSASPDEFFASARKYYEDYLAQTLSLELPDEKLQAAYDWSRISTIQGLVTNPYLGTGLIAGYRSSGETARPGFAWFFGRDSLWTDLALDAIGDFKTTRTALEFIAKYQRQDGKVEHEISQTASMVNWWSGYPYAYASADATPLFLIAMGDYVQASGDVAFAREHWDNAWRAYQFLKSTYNANGLPRNFGIGHGWIEGGPLLPVETESYQSGLGAAALQAMISIASAAGKDQGVQPIINESQAQRGKVNESFWDAADHTLAFALDKDNKPIATPTVLTTAPMWFNIFDTNKANATIDHIANWDSSTDWGMRVISEQHPMFGPTGYHFGSVWPLFTGWAAVGEYRSHRPIEAYANLRANALLAFDGPLGHVTEVLSGSYYEGLATASPHQIWSSAMVISPLVRGMLGITVWNHFGHEDVVVEPHIPADWDEFIIHDLSACNGNYDVRFRREAGSVTFKISGGKSECRFAFSPAFSKHARILGATVNGKKVAYKADPNEQDQHVWVDVAAPGELVIRVADDFGLIADTSLPPLGSESRNLKIFHEQWSNDNRQLTLQLSGLRGRGYQLRGYGARMVSVSGGELKEKSGKGSQIIELLPIPGEDKDKYVERKIVIRF